MDWRPGILGVNAGAGTAIVILCFLSRTIKSTDWVSIMMMPMFGLVGGLGALSSFICFLGKR